MSHVSPQGRCSPSVAVEFCLALSDTCRLRSASIRQSPVRSKPAPTRPASSAGTARAAASPCAICHSRARPCGSTIRKKMISAPKMISSRFDTTRVRDLDAGRVRDRLREHAEEDRQQRDERRAEERAEDAAHAADDDHEQDPEREVEVERLGLHRAEVAVRVQRAGHAAVERADREGEQLGRASAGCRSRSAATSMSRTAMNARPISLRTRFFASSASTRDDRQRRAGTCATGVSKRVAEDLDLLRGDRRPTEL